MPEFHCLSSPSPCQFHLTSLTDVGSLNHADIVSPIANAAYMFLGMVPDKMVKIMQRNDQLEEETRNMTREGLKMPVMAKKMGE